MKVTDLHRWSLSYSKARHCQSALASKVRFIPLKKKPKLIAGLDCAFTKDGKKIIAAVVVLKAPDFTPIETASALRKLTFPYIPGLLSFREAPACIAAVKKLKTTPDIFIIDGQGIAHPRRLGLAAHLGLFFDKPTIGCAKSRLTGFFEEPPSEKGAYTFLMDKESAMLKKSDGRPVTSDDVIGAVVRTRTNVKPLFVSVGNKCLLKDAVKITLRCAIKYRLPEPTRLAHQLVGKLRLTA
ncbi:MAG: endonuclease V [Phycisphaerae bacterium]|nr:endonuclease V [Phycisphaerae bacterium]NIS50193.1 endonuclease V [Phycisphaerae bacterium]NIU11444.1 endonuclease V [Phycisphaerae bacterium]NIU56493.1 endonuclease V [Phycisphaerae bacterium]NIV01839.1 endonuclease V [Phycisphaerae bacterium]